MARKLIEPIRHRLTREYTSVEGEARVGLTTVDSLVRKRAFRKKHRVIVRLRR